jgi:hypothetical protein
MEFEASGPGDCWKHPPNFCLRLDDQSHLAIRGTANFLSDQSRIQFSTDAAEILAESGKKGKGYKISN